MNFYNKKQQPTILLIVDDAQLRILLEESIRKGDYHVISAMNSEEAHSMLMQEKIALVLLDLARPTPNDIKRYRLIHQQYKIPFAVLTLLPTADARLYARQLGARAFLTKPVRIIALHNCIQSLLGNFAARSSNSQKEIVNKI